MGSNRTVNGPAGFGDKAVSVWTALLLIMEGEIKVCLREHMPHKHGVCVYVTQNSPLISFLELGWNHAQKVSQCYK